MLAIWHLHKQDFHLLHKSISHLLLRQLLSSRWLHQRSHNQCKNLSHLKRSQKEIAQPIWWDLLVYYAVEAVVQVLFSLFFGLLPQSKVFIHHIIWWPTLMNLYQWTTRIRFFKNKKIGILICNQIHLSDSTTNWKRTWDPIETGTMAPDAQVKSSDTSMLEKLSQSKRLPSSTPQINQRVDMVMNPK